MAGFCSRRWKSHQSISSLQCGFFRPSQRSFTPESCSSLPLRFSSLRLEELRTEDRTAQLSLVRLQLHSLREKKISLVTLHRLLIPLFLMIQLYICRYYVIVFYITFMCQHTCSYGRISESIKDFSPKNPKKFIQQVQSLKNRNQEILKSYKVTSKSAHTPGQE